jgi:hypothetical protein
MATDFAIRILMNEGGSGGVTSDQIPTIVQRVLGVVSADTLVLTHAAGYVAGSRTYNATIGINTVGTPNFGIALDIDANVSSSRKAAILASVIQKLSSFTLTLPALNTSYSAGGSSANEVTLTVS